MGNVNKLDVKQRHKVAWPSMMEVVRNPSYFVAFGFGIGLIRPGSGTWGSLLAVLIWLPLMAWMSWPMLGLIIVLAFVLGCIACDRAGQRIGVDDHVGMVWDEMVAVWMLLWALPQQPLIIIVAVILFRVFDVSKPFPISLLDSKVHGGVGVMIDDVVAALYAWLVTTGLLFLLPSIGVTI